MKRLILSIHITTILLTVPIFMCGQNVASSELLSRHHIGKETLTKGMLKFAFADDGYTAIVSSAVEWSYNTMQTSKYELLDTLVIPAEIVQNGRRYAVVAIATDGFSNCNSFRHLVIQDGIRHIYKNAFMGCSALESIYIPASIERINGNPFTHCSELKSIVVDTTNVHYTSKGETANAIIDIAEKRLVSGCSATSIPDFVEIIGDCAFYGQQNLHSLHLPPSIKKIEGYAFADSGLEDLKIPSSTSNIGQGIFAGCNNLTHIDVVRNNRTYNSARGYNVIIETATNNLVAACSKSKIPKNTKKIANSAFADLHGLRSVKIPPNVSVISPLAFSGCKNLVKLSVAHKNQTFDSRSRCNAIIETATKTLIEACSATTIPSNINAIGQSAFSKVVVPHTLVLPEGIKEIGDFAYEQCHTLQSIVLPSTLKTLGKGAFAKCLGLKNVIIQPHSITQLKQWMFADCISLRQLHLPEGCDSIHPNALIGCVNLQLLTHGDAYTNISLDFADGFKQKETYESDKLYQLSSGSSIK